MSEIAFEGKKLETENESYFEKLEKFLFRDFIKVVLDDEIFDFNEQYEKITFLMNRWKEFSDIRNKPWMWNKNIVTFAGRFNAGKSSLINAIFDMEVLPVDLTPTTAVPIYVTNLNDDFVQSGKALAVTLRDRNILIDEEKIKLFVKDSKNLSPTITDVSINVSDMIKYFLLNRDNPWLINKIIVDTPGIDPGDIENEKLSRYDEELTANSLKISDLVVWVVDVNDGGLGRSSLDFLKNNLPGDSNLVIAINKSDTKHKKAVSKVCRNVENELKSFLKKEDFEIIPVSAKTRFNINKLKLKLSAKSTDNRFKRFKNLILGILQDAIDRVDRNIIKSQRSKYEGERISNMMKKLNHIETIIHEVQQVYNTLGFLRSFNQNFGRTVEKILENYIIEGIRSGFEILESIKNEAEFLKFPDLEKPDFSKKKDPEDLISQIGVLLFITSEIKDQINALKKIDEFKTERLSSKLVQLVNLKRYANEILSKTP